MLETPPEVSPIEEPPKPGDELLPEPVAALSEELTRVSAEIQSINAGFQSQLVQALTEMQRAMERDFKARLDRELQAMRSDLMARTAEVDKEIGRVNSILDSVTKEINALLEDPSAELSRMMRMKAEESVLRSYLDGLKFAAGIPR